MSLINDNRIEWNELIKLPRITVTIELISIIIPDMPRTSSDNYFDKLTNLKQSQSVKTWDWIHDYSMLDFLASVMNELLMIKSLIHTSANMENSPKNNSSCFQSIASAISTHESSSAFRL